MEVKERIIDLRQFFIYLWENAIIIIIVAGLCCGGLMGFSYKKQKDEIASTTAADKAVINTIITQNHDAFYGLSSDNKKVFTDAVPPANTYNSSARLYVDFNFSNIEGGENLDLSKILYSYQQDALILLVSDEALQNVIDKLDLHKYDDMKAITPDNLKWLINKNFNGANVMQVIVSDVDNERAKLIADALIEEFVSRASGFSTIDSVEIIDTPSVPEEGMQPTATSTSIDKKKLLKYGIVGGVGGLILICGLFLLIFIFNDTIRNNLDASFAEVKVFATVSRKEKKRKEDAKRIAYNISLIGDDKKVTIVPVDKKSENEDLISSIKESLSEVSKNIKLDVVPNIKESAEATRAAVNSDAVLLVAKYGKTRMNDLIFAKGEMDKTNVDILGVVLSDFRSH